jgi:hypothetical protein
MLNANTFPPQAVYTDPNQHLIIGESVQIDEIKNLFNYATVV